MKISTVKSMNSQDTQKMDYYWSEMRRSAVKGSISFIAAVGIGITSQKWMQQRPFLKNVSLTASFGCGFFAYYHAKNIDICFKKITGIPPISD